MAVSRLTADIAAELCRASSTASGRTALAAGRRRSTATSCVAAGFMSRTVFGDQRAEGDALAWILPATFPPLLSGLRTGASTAAFAAAAGTCASRPPRRPRRVAHVTAVATKLLVGLAIGRCLLGWRGVAAVHFFGLPLLERKVLLPASRAATGAVPRAGPCTRKESARAVFCCRLLDASSVLSAAASALGTVACALAAVMHELEPLRGHRRCTKIVPAGRVVPSFPRLGRKG